VAQLIQPLELFPNPMAPRAKICSAPHLTSTNWLALIWKPAGLSRWNVIVRSETFHSFWVYSGTSSPKFFQSDRPVLTTDASQVTRHSKAVGPSRSAQCYSTTQSVKPLPRRRSSSTGSLP